MTEALAILEGIERGPAGNTSLAAAFSLSQELKQDQIIIVQETEYTSAGKHHQAQLSFARENGICIYFGDPQDEIPGESIVLPKAINMIKAIDLDLDSIRKKYLHNQILKSNIICQTDIDFLVVETNTSRDFVMTELKKYNVKVED